MATNHRTTAIPAAQLCPQSDADGAVSGAIQLSEENSAIAQPEESIGFATLRLFG
jgi:hypothetical protein